MRPVGKARTAKPAQVRILERLDDVLDRALAVEAIGEELIAALGPVAVEIDVARNVRVRLAGGDRLRDALDARMLMQRMADRGDRRVVAAAHAGRADDAHARFKRALQLRQQPLGARHGAGEAVADPDRDRRRGRLAVHDDVEMGVEGGDLVDLDERKPHLVRERHEMARVQAAVLVLKQMQMLDQEIGPARPVAEEPAHLVEGLRIDLPPLRRLARLPPA